MRDLKREDSWLGFNRRHIISPLLVLIVVGMAVVPFGGVTIAQSTAENGSPAPGSNSSSNLTETPSMTPPGSQNQTAVTETSSSTRSSQRAAVTIQNQSTTGSTITIRSINLPDGGYAVVHDSSFLPPENQTYQSVIGVSEKLGPGIHRNVSINLSRVVSGSLKSQLGFQYNSRVVVSAAHDTGVNGEYEFANSSGEKDGIYGSQSSSLVYDTAYITKAKQTTNQSTGENQSSPTNSTASKANQGTAESAATPGSNPSQERGVVDWLLNNILMVSIGVAIVCSLVVGEIISRQID